MPPPENHWQSRSEGGGTVGGSLGTQNAIWGAWHKGVAGWEVEIAVVISR